MKTGDIVEFVGSWRTDDGPKIGVVMETWTNGRTKQLSSADVFWDTGSLGNVLVTSLVVIDESR